MPDGLVPNNRANFSSRQQRTHGHRDVGAARAWQRPRARGLATSLCCGGVATAPGTSAVQTESQSSGVFQAAENFLLVTPWGWSGGPERRGHLYYLY